MNISRRKDRYTISSRLTVLAIPTGLLEANCFGHEKGCIHGRYEPENWEARSWRMAARSFGRVADIPSGNPAKGFCEALQDRSLNG